MLRSKDGILQSQYAGICGHPLQLLYYRLLANVNQCLISGKTLLLPSLSTFLGRTSLSQTGAWGNYADRDEVGPVIATGRTGEGRVARRARRREALKEKRMESVAEKLARKKMVSCRVCRDKP